MSIVEKGKEKSYPVFPKRRIHMSKSIYMKIKTVFSNLVVTRLLGIKQRVFQAESKITTVQKHQQTTGISGTLLTPRGLEQCQLKQMK